MIIPFHNIQRFFLKNQEQIQKLSLKIYSTGKVVAGKETEELEKNLCALNGRKYAVTTGSCTDALYFALYATGLKPKDEIFIPAFSFIASLSSVVRAGLVPVFCDINSKSFMLNLQDAENKITKKTKAILAVNLFGATLNKFELENFAKKNNLLLIEDAAQSLGNPHQEFKWGSIGKASCLSFVPTKIVGVYGSGGAVLTDDGAIYETVKKLRYHGKDMNTGQFTCLGYNSQISEFDAALLNYQLNFLDKIVEERNKIASIYCNELSNIPEIILPEINSNPSSFHKFVIRVSFRDKLEKVLSEAGIQTMKHFSYTLDEANFLKEFSHKAENIKIAQQIKNQVLSLPIYPELTEQEIRFVCASIKKIFKK